jgi:hypothetical protein
MTPEDRYQAWLQKRAEAPVPEGFAGRVMKLVHAEPPTQPIGRGPQVLFLALCSSRACRIAASALACLVCAIRMIQMVALFLPR